MPTPDRRPRHFSMIREFHLADFFTLANAACGVLALFFCMQYLIGGRLEEFLLGQFVFFGQCVGFRFRQQSRTESVVARFGEPLGQRVRRADRAARPTGVLVST